ncbi:phage tail protein I, partial [Haematospirillum jordaniae]
MADNLLPPSASHLERLLADVDAVRLGTLDIVIRDIWNPATCPAPFLPWLAWALSVDVWNPDWPEARKRAVIAASFQVHRHKGTRRAVREALE